MATFEDLSVFDERNGDMRSLIIHRQIAGVEAFQVTYERGQTNPLLSPAIIPQCSLSRCTIGISSRCLPQVHHILLVFGEPSTVCEKTPSVHNRKISLILAIPVICEVKLRIFLDHRFHLRPRGVLSVCYLDYLKKKTRAGRPSTYTRLRYP